MSYDTPQKKYLKKVFQKVVLSIYHKNSQNHILNN